MAQIRSIRWTVLALADLNHAHEYIEWERPASARDLIHRVESAVSALVHYPLMGRSGRIFDTRELYIANSPFILAYRVKKIS